MKYIQKDENNVIIAMTETQPEVTEDANGIWLEVEDTDVITAENGKRYYQQANTVELEEFRKDRRTAKILNEIEALEASQARPLRELELMALGVKDETEKDFALNKLKQIQTDIESLRQELAELNAVAEAVPLEPEAFSAAIEAAPVVSPAVGTPDTGDVEALKAEVATLVQKLQALYAV